ncbi:translin family protein [Methanococcus aeolicus]|uniref:Translin n=1 Tax=Methanococcus aeolicus (strain ATCC BAA-1280 / DSM 17508 / OCM 812 / Nankai-3) TaxID=419665 RepID=A6UV69_META3|nr:haloacid dehalogenase [Methanococcus aeolicus]ABR56391.1 Translin [Methanococcus aeolicus Nankai-3]UXM84389.1 haloacid dehalogenase [Methanococcus aeolicus]
MENQNQNLLKYFEEKDKYRENSLKLSREIVRECGITIRHIHKKDNNISFDNLINKLDKLAELVKNNSDLNKYINTPQQEFVEAIVFYNITYKNNILSYSDFKDTTKNININIKPENYLLGLCDVIGELRRMILENIKNDNIKNAEKYYKFMEELYDFIMLFDCYNIVDGLRRKQDVSRSLLEKTNGDLVYFIENIKLREILKNRQ